MGLHANMPPTPSRPAPLAPFVRPKEFLPLLKESRQDSWSQQPSVGPAII